MSPTVLKGSKFCELHTSRKTNNIVAQKREKVNSNDTILCLWLGSFPVSNLLDYLFIVCCDFVYWREDAR